MSETKINLVNRIIHQYKPPMICHRCKYEIEYLERFTQKEGKTIHVTCKALKEDYN